MVNIAQFIGQKVPFRPHTVHWDQADKRPWVEVFNSKAYNLSAWVLGWRNGDSTGIHDHMHSCAGIYVVEGELQETVYATDHRRLAEEGRHAAYALVRHLYGGSLVSLEFPYIHDFENKEERLAITVHVYSPRLEMMTLYGYREDQQLCRTGEWRYPAR